MPRLRPFVALAVASVAALGPLTAAGAAPAPATLRILTNHLGYEAHGSKKFIGQKRAPVDVHGGWFDASGDVSKYLTHLSYANYLNPQQSPMAVWAMLEASELLRDIKSERLKNLRPRLDEEAIYGADFLVRMQDPAGYFY